MITISIVSPQKSMDVIDRAISHHDFGCIFRKYVYDQLEEIKDIYEQCKDSYPVSGNPLKPDLYRLSDSGQ